MILARPQQNTVRHKYDTIDTVWRTMVTFKIDQSRPRQHARNAKSQSNSFRQTNRIS